MARGIVALLLAAASTHAMAVEEQSEAGWLGFGSPLGYYPSGAPYALTYPYGPQHPWSQLKKFWKQASADQNTGGAPEQTHKPSHEKPRGWSKETWLTRFLSTNAKHRVLRAEKKKADAPPEFFGNGRSKPPRPEPWGFFKPPFLGSEAVTRQKPKEVTATPPLPLEPELPMPDGKIANNPRSAGTVNLQEPDPPWTVREDLGKKYKPRKSNYKPPEADGTSRTISLGGFFSEKVLKEDLKMYSKKDQKKFKQHELNTEQRKVGAAEKSLTSDFDTTEGIKYLRRGPEKGANLRPEVVTKLKHVSALNKKVSELKKDPLLKAKAEREEEEEEEEKEEEKDKDEGPSSGAVKAAIMQKRSGQ